MSGMSFRLASDQAATRPARATHLLSAVQHLLQPDGIVKLKLLVSNLVRPFLVTLGNNVQRAGSKGRRDAKRAGGEGDDDKDPHGPPHRAPFLSPPSKKTPLLLFFRPGALPWRAYLLHTRRMASF